MNTDVDYSYAEDLIFDRDVDSSGGLGLTVDIGADSGRRTLTIPTKPRTGRFNSRGRGRAALERGIGPKQGWRIQMTQECRAVMG